MTMSPFAIALALLFGLGIARGADIVGTVSLDSGQSPEGVTILIQSARMRTGDSMMCSTCWRECQRSARANAKGEFRIPEVSDDLVFNLLALAEHHAPVILLGVDPEKKPATLSLTRRNLSNLPLTHQIRGQVLDHQNRPLSGATIFPNSSGPSDDDQTLTNADGHFILCSSKTFKRTKLKITAPGHAGMWIEVAKRTEDAADVRVSLQRGSTVVGRLLHEGRPVPNVTVGAAQTNRSAGQFLGPLWTTTDTEGRFAIHDVRSDDDWVIYGEMDSTKSSGFIPAREFHSPSPGSIHDFGDIQTTKALTLQGRLVRQDGRPFPEGTRMGLSRSSAWDGQRLDVAPDGTFTAEGLPSSEELSLNLPPNIYVVSSADGFTSDRNAQGLTFRLKESLSGLSITVVEKDRQTKQQEDLMVSVQTEFAPFLEQAKLPQDQAQALMDLLVARRTDLQNAVHADPHAYSQCLSATQKSYAPRLKALLGPALYQALDHWELCQDGQGFAEVISAHGGSPWLTPEEAQMITLAMGRLQRLLSEFHASRPPQSELNPDQMASMLNWLQSESYEATASVVPPAKHETLRKAIQALYELAAQESSE